MVSESMPKARGCHGQGSVRTQDGETRVSNLGICEKTKDGDDGESRQRGYPSGDICLSNWAAAASASTGTPF
jgi:hypothetical protein